MKKLSLAFVWHMHQPVYQAKKNGIYLMPWIRLHAVKDYLDMLKIIERFPKIKLNFDLVPALLDAIEDYAYNNANDLHSLITITPWKNITKEDKLFILNNFFDANYKNMILPNSYYAELYQKRCNCNGFDIDIFSEQQYQDIMVWFNLCWIDNMWKEYYPEVKYLIEKNKNFSYEDRLLVVNIHRKIMKDIIPSYKKMQKNGRIEIITTAYYHPIMPMLMDINDAKNSTVMFELPNNISSMEKDLKYQIKKSIDKYIDFFEREPKGLWLPELCISEKTLDLVSDFGFKWTIADEGILANSLQKEFIRDFRGYLEDPYDITQIYKYKTKSRKSINILFRDTVLPNLLSFEYPNHSAKTAANDFYDRIKSVQDKLLNSPDKKAILTIAMDGENCWENYSNDGIDFLENIYDLISNDEELETVLVSSFIESNKKTKVLNNVAAGSWINRNFQLWIAEPTKNLAWQYLNQVRLDLIKYSEQNKQKDLSQAWEELYIAQASDWFWWFGEPNNSGQDNIFDYLFRTHLKNVYLLINETPPDYLDIPIDEIIKDYSVVSKRLLTPVNNNDNLDRWDFAGCINIPSGPVLQDKKLYHKVCFGYDEENLYLKLEVNKFLFEDYIKSNHVEFYIYFQNTEKLSTTGANITTICREDLDTNILKNKFTHELKLSFSKEHKYPPRFCVANSDNLWIVQLASKTMYAYDDIIEIKIPFEELSLNKGDELKFLVINAPNGVVEEFYPYENLFSIFRP